MQNFLNNQCLNYRQNLLIHQKQGGGVLNWNKLLDLSIDLDGRTLMEKDYDNEEYGPSHGTEEEEEEDKTQADLKNMSDSEKAARSERLKKQSIKRLFG